MFRRRGGRRGQNLRREGEKLSDAAAARRKAMQSALGLNWTSPRVFSPVEITDADLATSAVRTSPIGAFYWIDRSIQPSNSLDYKRGTMSFQHLVETIVQEIRKFLEVQPVLVLVSKASIFGAGTSIDAQRDIEMCTSSRDTDKVLYREYMPSAWQAFVTHRINLQLSDKYTNDKKGGTSPIYTSEWVQPPLNIKDQFAVADDGIYLI